MVILKGKQYHMVGWGVLWQSPWLQPPDQVPLRVLEARGTELIELPKVYRDEGVEVEDVVP